MPLRRWSHQPPIGLQYKLNPALPQPWAVFRPLGDKLQAYGAAITSTTYTSVTAATTRDGYGIKIAGAGGDGVKVAYTDQMDRSTWAVAVIVRVDGSGTTQTIIGMNGDLNGLQARVNTSAQLELLRQGAVLLVTSSYAGFTAGSVHCVVIRNPNGTSDSITAWANGKLIATNSSGVDNSASDSALYFGQRFAGVSQSLNGAIVEAAHWSGTIPTAEQCQAISADYWGTVIEPMRTPGGIPGAAGGGGAITIDATTGNAVAAGVTGVAGVAATINGVVGNATAAGITGTVSVDLSIAGVVGNAVAAGVTGAPAVGISIDGVVGNAVAAGVSGVPGVSIEIAGTVGNAVAAGVAGSPGVAITITGNVGNAVAAGVSGLAAIGILIDGVVGNATAAGVTGGLSLDIVVVGVVGNAAAAGVTGAVSLSGGSGADPADVWAYELAPGVSAGQYVTEIHAMLTTLTGGSVVLPVNVKQVNDVTIAGAGVAGSNPWRPA